MVKLMSKPNLIYIITDQQRYDTINELGYDFMDTPNLDKFVREGVTFTNCYTAGLSCAPSRGAIFTNYYPHTTGIIKNACNWKDSWFYDFKKAGYHTVNFGKMHTWPLNTPCGFVERYNVENKDRFLEARYYFDEWDKALASHGLIKQRREEYRLRKDYNQSLGAFYWQLPEKLHSDIFVGNMACWWLKNYPKTEPLCMQIGFPGPHPPYDPVKRFADEYMDKKLDIEPINKEDINNQPLAYKIYREHCYEVDHDSVTHHPEIKLKDRFRQRAFYCANISMIDEKIGEIIKTLNDQDYLKNTIIVFTSDHGDCLGDHGHSQKWTSYEQIVKVPMIIWGPGCGIPKGIKCDSLCQQFDISHMLLDICGLNLVKNYESISALPFLNNNEWKGREVVYAEQSKDGNFTGADFTSMVRTKEWKLTHFLGKPDGQLHDLKNDPRENTNLWKDPGYKNIKNEMIDQLFEWRMYSNLHHNKVM